MRGLNRWDSAVPRPETLLQAFQGYATSAAVDGGRSRGLGAGLCCGMCAVACTCHVSAFIDGRDSVVRSRVLKK